MITINGQEYEVPEEFKEALEAYVTSACRQPLSRRSGNTTRLADMYIQQLFLTRSITMTDRPGRSVDINSHLFNVVLNRLHAEHRGLRFVFDKFKLTISLL